MAAIRTMLLVATVLLAVSFGLPWSVGEDGECYGIDGYGPVVSTDPRPIRLLVIYAIVVLTTTEAWRLNRSNAQSFTRVVISVTTVWFSAFLAFGAWMTWLDKYAGTSKREVGANCMLAAIALLGAASACCVSHVIGAYRMNQVVDGAEEVREAAPGTGTN